MRLICGALRLKKVELRAWEIIDKHNPSIDKPGSFEGLVMKAAKDLGEDLTEEEVGALAYHVASGG